MANKSRIDKFELEVKELIEIGVSIRSAWKIINSKLSNDGKISYSAFYHFSRRFNNK